jgi:hypothetical protein
MELYLSDLTPAAQAEYLALMGLESAEDGNFDTIPIHFFEAPEDTDYDEGS